MASKGKQKTVLIYLHIPKCAGSTMMAILRRNYKGFFRVRNGGHWRTTKIPESVTCLTGHIPYSIGNRISAPVRYATMLRNPVERLISLYTFCQTYTGHKWHKRAVNMTLGEFVSDCPMADLDNGMVRWLSGRHDVGTLKRHTRIRGWDYQRAIDHLSLMSTICFVEDFDNSIRRLGEPLRWRNFNYKIKQRGQKKHYSPSDADVRVVRDVNRFDIELYDWAKGRVQ